MTTPNKRYTRASFPVLVYSGTTPLTARLVRDGDSWEEFDEEAIESYLSEGAHMLIESVHAFFDPGAPYTSMGAKELRFMLEALIEIKEVFSEDLNAPIEEETLSRQSSRCPIHS